LRFLLATNPAVLTQVVGVVYRAISDYLLKSAGLTRTTGHAGAVTLIQRFGSALNLNIHFHMLFLDGVYVIGEAGQAVFRHSTEPGAQDLQTLVEHITERIGRALEKQGLIERDIENAWLTWDGEGGALDDLLGHSITYRIAVGPRAGQRLFTLQTVPARPPEWLDDPNGAARVGGFSLHAGVDIAANQRAKLERLCRYVSRPPVASEPMALTASGHVRYALKTRYRDGTTHIVLEPLDLMARLAALVPPPRTHLTRYHGVFAPHRRLRAAVTPAQRGMGAPQSRRAADSVKPPIPRHVVMDRSRRLKRVFGIEIEGCARCGGKLAILASIEEPEVIARILAHLEKSVPGQNQGELPLGARAPPSQASLLGILRWGRFRWPVTRPGRGGACRHCAGRQARAVCGVSSRDGPGIYGAKRPSGCRPARPPGRIRAGRDRLGRHIRPDRRSKSCCRGAQGWFEFPTLRRIPASHCGLDPGAQRRAHRWRSAPLARRRSATCYLRRGSPCR
jgi:hypothetical protein